MAGKNSGGSFQFRLDWNRGGDDTLPIKYVSVHLITGWEWLSVGPEHD